MRNCVAGGSELEPPIRTPHTVYAKTLYRIAGRDCYPHHIIRAAVAVGVITEVKPGPGPVVATSWGAPSTEHDRPHQYRLDVRHNATPVQGVADHSGAQDRGNLLPACDQLRMGQGEEKGMMELSAC